VHFLRNALDYLPRKADDDCLQELRWLYARRNLAEAQHDLAAWLNRWQKKYPKLTNWVEDNIGSTLTFYRLPRQHHKYLKSKIAKLGGRCRGSTLRSSKHTPRQETVIDLRTTRPSTARRFRNSSTPRRHSRPLP